MHILGISLDHYLYVISIQIFPNFDLFVDSKFSSTYYNCWSNGLDRDCIKTSTVLVFSVALGIAIDVTIRFLINYKQELPHFNNKVPATLVQTIKHTGISIIYTSLVLTAGFIIFVFSDFGGTNALGWLTSLTLVVGTLTNLVLLPVLILSTSPKIKS